MTEEEMSKMRRSDASEGLSSEVLVLDVEVIAAGVNASRWSMVCRAFMWTVYAAWSP